MFFGDNMTLRVTVEGEECIGCGACTAFSDNFVIDDKSIAKVKKELIGDDEKESNQEAVDACPKHCIKIEEVDG